MIGEPEQRLRLYRYRSIYNTFIIFLKLSQNTIICKSCRYNIHPNIHIFSKKIYWNLSKDVFNAFHNLIIFLFLFKIWILDISILFRRKHNYVNIFIILANAFYWKYYSFKFGCFETNTIFDYIFFVLKTFKNWINMPMLENCFTKL